MPEVAERFDAYVKKYFDWAIKEFPTYATFLGIHDYDDQLGDHSLKRIKERLSIAKRALRDLKRFNPRKLDSVRATDWNVVRCSLETSIFSIEELRGYQKDPDYVSTVAEAVYPLFVRDFAPAPVRFKNIAARVSQVPKLLEDGRENVTRPMKAFCEVALEGMPRTVGFLKLIASVAPNVVDSSLSGELSSAVEQASKEIQDYEKHVKALLPKADTKFAMGAAKMRKLLRLRRLPFTMDQMLRLARRVLKQRHGQLSELANSIKPGATWKEVGQSLKGNPPSDFKTVWADFENIIQSARNFVRERRLASVPDSDSLRLMETPTFVRHVIPTAAYMSPPAFEKDQTGFFFVTPVEDKVELLKEHVHQYVVTTVVHEAYPGHHLHLSWSNKNPSLARRLFFEAALVEGWAHYCEELVLEENNFDPSPETRLAFLQDAAWRAARVIIDISLHTGKMTFEQAVGFLVDATGMERERALREVKRYVITPGQPLSYLIGKETIKALRKKARRKLGKSYSDQLFHDRIMQTGMVTFEELERAVLVPVN